MGKVLVQAHVEENIKQAATEILELNGLEVPTAIRMFFAKITQVGGIPFEVRIERSGQFPSRTLLASEDFDRLLQALDEPMPPEAEALLDSAENQ